MGRTNFGARVEVEPDAVIDGAGLVAVRWRVDRLHLLPGQVDWRVATGGGMPERTVDPGSTGWIPRTEAGYHS